MSEKAQKQVVTLTHHNSLKIRSPRSPRVHCKGPNAIATSQNVTSTEFLEVQIPLHILVNDWDPQVSCVKRQKRAKIWWKEEEEEEEEEGGGEAEAEEEEDENIKQGNSDYVAFPYANSSCI